MTTTPTEPAFIVVDGPDGVGISTQCDRLVGYLRGRGIAVCSTVNPSENPVGKMIRQMLLHNIPALPPSAMQRAYVTDRDANNQLVVEPARARGEVVVQARGEWSTVVYNAARGATEEEREYLASVAFGMHEGMGIPTLTIILVAELEVTEARRGKRGGPVELFDGSDFQARVISLYEDAYNLTNLDWTMRWEGPGSRDKLIIIDAAADEDEIHCRVLKAIRDAGIIPQLHGGAP